MSGPILDGRWSAHVFALALCISFKHSKQLSFNILDTYHTFSSTGGGNLPLITAHSFEFLLMGATLSMLIAMNRQLVCKK